MNLATRILAPAALAAGVVLGGVAPAFAHQHLSAPSGNCAAEGSNVPQGSANPGGNTPGNLNNAADNERATEHCNNG